VEKFDGLLDSDKPTEQHRQTDMSAGASGASRQSPEVNNNERFGYSKRYKWVAFGIDTATQKDISAWNCTSATEGFKSKGTKAAIIGASQPFRSNQVQVQPSLDWTCCCYAHPPVVRRDPPAPPSK
jgi:hypothetical protein